MEDTNTSAAAGGIRKGAEARDTSGLAKVVFLVNGHRRHVGAAKTRFKVVQQ
jgi:hypothetical protein